MFNSSNYIDLLWEMTIVTQEVIYHANDNYILVVSVFRLLIGKNESGIAPHSI